MVAPETNVVALTQVPISGWKATRFALSTMTLYDSERMFNV